MKTKPNKMKKKSHILCYKVMLTNASEIKPVFNKNELNLLTLACACTF